MARDYHEIDSELVKIKKRYTEKSSALQRFMLEMFKDNGEESYKNKYYIAIDELDSIKSDLVYRILASLKMVRFPGKKYFKQLALKMVKKANQDTLV